MHPIIVNTASFSLTPSYNSTLTRQYSSRNTNNIPHFKVKNSFFKNTLFPSVIIEWNKLDPEIQNTPSLDIFKRNILKVYKTYCKQHTWLPKPERFYIFNKVTNWT